MLLLLKSTPLCSQNDFPTIITNQCWLGTDALFARQLMSNGLSRRSMVARCFGHQFSRLTVGLFINLSNVLQKKSQTVPAKVHLSSRRCVRLQSGLIWFVLLLKFSWAAHLQMLIHTEDRSMVSHAYHRENKHKVLLWRQQWPWHEGRSQTAKHSTWWVAWTRSVSPGIRYFPWGHLEQKHEKAEAEFLFDHPMKLMSETAGGPEKALSA